MNALARRSLLALALLALPALAVAGCGGDDKAAEATTAAALTADQWRTQADAICADIDTKADALKQPEAPADFQGFLEAGIPLAQDQIDRLKALVPPAELASIQTQAVANQEEGLATIKGALDRIKGGEDPLKVVTEVQADITRIQDEGKKLAKDAGLTVCGADDDTTGTTSTDATTESTDTTATIPTTGNAEVDKFLGDVQKATTALTAFGNALQSVSDPAEIKAQESSLRGQLGDFDSAIAAMDGYTLPIEVVEGQRSRIVATGPKVSDVLRKFIDAGAGGDEAEIIKLLPEVTTALTDFTKAAQPQ
jgi:hypothetical protein